MFDCLCIRNYVSCYSFLVIVFINNIFNDFGLRVIIYRTFFIGLDHQYFFCILFIHIFLFRPNIQWYIILLERVISLHVPSVIQLIISNLTVFYGPFCTFWIAWFSEIFSWRVIVILVPGNSFLKLYIPLVRIVLLIVTLMFVMSGSVFAS